MRNLRMTLYQEMKSLREEALQDEINGQLKISEENKDLEIMKEYLLLKFRKSDWHGVADAACDIREMLGKK
jgi:hypothetical protein